MGDGRYQRLFHVQNKTLHVVQGYEEGKVHFPPTFKFDIGSSHYCTNRVPSWTDRVLWKVQNATDSTTEQCSVRQTYYESIHDMNTSDHKPVIAGFDVCLGNAAMQINTNQKHKQTKCVVQ